MEGIDWKRTSFNLLTNNVTSICAEKGIKNNKIKFNPIPFRHQVFPNSMVCVAIVFNENISTILPFICITLLVCALPSQQWIRHNYPKVKVTKTRQVKTSASPQWQTKKRREEKKRENG